MIERLTLGWKECEPKVYAKTYLLMNFHHGEDMPWVYVEWIHILSNWQIHQ